MAETRPQDLSQMQATLDGFVTDAKATPSIVLADIKAQALAILKLITLDPRPSYTVRGQTFKYSEYVKTLRDLITWADKEEAGVGEVGPYEIELEYFG